MSMLLLSLLPSIKTPAAGLREHQLKELAYAVFLSCCGKTASRGLLASLRCALGTLWLSAPCNIRCWRGAMHITAAWRLQTAAGAAAWLLQPLLVLLPCARLLLPLYNLQGIARAARGACGRAGSHHGAGRQSGGGLAGQPGRAHQAAAGGWGLEMLLVVGGGGTSSCCR